MLGEAFRHTIKAVGHETGGPIQVLVLAMKSDDMIGTGKKNARATVAARRLE